MMNYATFFHLILGPSAFLLPSRQVNAQGFFSFEGTDSSGGFQTIQFDQNFGTSHTTTQTSTGNFQTTHTTTTHTSGGNHFQSFQTTTAGGILLADVTSADFNHEFQFGMTHGDSNQFGATDGSGTLCGVQSSTSLTCGHVNGDPHVYSFDNVRYDCQGEGEFVLAKNNNLEIQGRFMAPHTYRDATVLKSVAFSVCDDTVIQVSVPEETPSTGQPGDTQCTYRFHRGDEEVQLADIPEFTSSGNRLVFGKDESFFVAISVTYSSWLGCTMALEACIPDGTDGVVGLFGTPNGNRADDWTKPGDLGQDIVPSASNYHELLFEPAYNYCMNWCANSDTSLFKYEGGKSISDYNLDCAVGPDQDPEPYNDSVERALDNVPANVKSECGDDVQCQIEGVVGGLEASRSFKNAEEHMVEIETLIQELLPDSTITFSTQAPSGGANGDPHFKTWAGGHYDYHGLCDLVLLENHGFQDGLGMDIHIRTKQLGQWSYISNAALRIGEDTLEMVGMQDGSSRHWFNGIEGEKIETDKALLESSLSGYPVTFERINERQEKFSVDLGDNEMIVIKTWNDLVRVDVLGAKAESFGNSRGLIGKFQTGERLARDSLTELKDTNAFGQEWQVQIYEPKLFHLVEGAQSPQLCEIPSTSEVRRRLGESRVSEEQAETACSQVDPMDRDPCIFDVMATNNLDLAGAY